MAATNRFHFPSDDDREERFGQLKFGAHWVGRQTDADLRLLDHFHPPNNYVAFNPLGHDDLLEESRALSRASIEDYEYGGPVTLRDEALAAFDRALKRRRQLKEVQEMLRLYDKYGDRPKNGSADFERLDPGDDREKLREALRIANTAALPIKRDQQSAPAHVASKRGSKSETRKRIAREIFEEWRTGKTTVDRLSDMSGPALERVYGAHRDTCKRAREAVLIAVQMLYNLRAGETTVDRLTSKSGPAFEQVYNACFQQSVVPSARIEICELARTIALAEFQSRQTAPISK